MEVNADKSGIERWRGYLAGSRRPALASLLLVVIVVVAGLLIGLAPLLIAVLGIGVWVAGFGFLTWRQRRREKRFGVATVAAHLSLVAVAAFVGIQFYPYGRDHSNPPVTGEPAWSSPRTRELMVNACFGCHSNEVEWPWYANIAPLSWAITDHVDEGREAVNYSEFPANAEEADESVEVILDGSMPPGYYTIFGLHPEANLSDSEIAELVAGLRATPGLSEGDSGDSDEGEDDD